MARAKPLYQYGQHLDTEAEAPSAPTEAEPAARPDPFDGDDGSISSAPEESKELAIMAFPVASFKQIADEAARRGMTFAQATKEAYDDWMAKSRRKAP